MLEGFTGYLLPWDQTAYWATVVGININGTAPFVGPFLAQFLRGGRRDRGGHAHALLLPAHAGDPGRDHRADRPAPLPRDPPRRHLAAVVGGGGRPRAARATPPPTGARGSSSRRRAEERRMASRGSTSGARSIKRYKEDVERAREAVLPVRDVPRHGDEPRRRVVIIGLAVRLVLHGRRGTDDAGLARPASTPRRPTRARRTSSRGPTGTSTSSSTCCGSSSGRTRSSSARSAIPTIAARAPVRAAVHRPCAASAGSRGGRSRSSRRSSSCSRWAMLTYKGATAKESLGGETSTLVPKWAADSRASPTTRRVAGAELFAGRRLPQLPHLPRHRRRRTSARPT